MRLARFEHRGEGKIFDVRRSLGLTGYRVVEEQLRLSADEGYAALCGPRRGPRMKHIRRGNGVRELERANLVVRVALAVQSVEHHLLLFGREGADAGKSGGLVEHFGRDFRQLW